MQTLETLGTATYSPEDNNLRFTPYCRLSKEDYLRARAAGFIWAPRQELFVAPMWTPEREDLLLEWCGEIDDEDKSLVERAEERAERFDLYSERRALDADNARAAVSAIADNIPLGQPILVGHHSERHARRDAEKIENGMRRAVKLWETSQYWTQRAAGALRAAKYKERPDVRERRIKKLEAEKRKCERHQNGYKDGLAFWRKCSDAAEGLKIAGLSNDANFPCQPNSWGGKFDAVDVLRPADHEWKHKECAVWTLDQVKEQAEVFYPPLIEHYQRWVDHYTNRLAYERAMLEEQGGTVQQKTGPEVGGACMCWASPRGGWSKIQKVNKVSVTVLDNWGNSGRDFTRTIPFDKLRHVMSCAQVAAARAEGRIRAETSLGFILADSTPVPAPKAHEPKPEAGKEFQAMKETLKAGVQVVTANQLFPTPATVAARMVDLADLCAGDKVLEPSGGTGVLVKEIKTRGIFKDDLFAVEVNFKLAAGLGEIASVTCADFLTLEPSDRLPMVDKVVMNPPFENGADIKHIRHALEFLNPGGRLVAICAGGPRQAEAFESMAEVWEELPAGTFAVTNVRSILMVIDKPE